MDSYNPSLEQLLSQFGDEFEKGLITGIYNDLHRQGHEALMVLEELQRNATVTGAKGTSKSTSRKKSFTDRRQLPQSISNSIADKRNHAADRIRIPGYHDRKAVYIMRGLSGSGKSTYARKIIAGLGRGEIFSTDEFFTLNEDNEYRFVFEDLDKAHKWNQNRVEGAMSDGVSPIIVDNTNTQFWEMRPYVIAAVESGYNCYFLEPPTVWKFKINQLMKKSTHGLNKGQLVAALKRYEKNPTVEKVLGSAYLSKMLPRKQASQLAPQQQKHKQLASHKEMEKKVETSGLSCNAKEFTPRKEEINRNTAEYLKKNNANEESLVPYILSDSSDDLMNEVAVSSSDDKDIVPPGSTHYREYNNNSACPKVRSEPFVGADREKISMGFGELNPDGYQGEQYDARRTQLEMESDISEWIAAAVERDIEDKLLEKLESQRVGDRMDDSLVEAIDQKKLMTQSAAALCTWEHATTSAVRAPTPQLRSKMAMLKEMCQEKLKSLLRSSYHNSPHYWNVHRQAMSLPHVRCQEELPNVSLRSEKEEEEEEDDCYRTSSLHLLEEYATVGLDSVPSRKHSLELGNTATEHVEDTCEIDARYDDAIEVLEDTDDEENEEEEKEDGEDVKDDWDELDEEREALMLKIDGILGPINKEMLYAACVECEWAEHDIIEMLLLKESLRELAEEAVKEEQENTQNTMKKLLHSKPPSIRTLLTDEAESSEDSSSPFATEEPGVCKVRYDSNDDTEVGNLSLPPRLTRTLTELFGTIVGLPTDKPLSIPVNLELASQLHAALYFAHTNGKTSGSKGKSRAYSGKERVKRMELGGIAAPPPPVIPHTTSLPFSQIVQYQKELPEKRGYLKQLARAYPGVDEQFLLEVLESCGNDVKRASRLLRTDPVHLKYLDEKCSLYSSRAEQSPGGSPKPPRSYTYLTHQPHSNNHDSSIVVQPGPLVEQARTYRRLADQNMEQARVWGSRKQTSIAGHYAKMGSRYKELANTKEMEIFNGTVVKDSLNELKNRPVLDLHGYTLNQSKYLLQEAIKHYHHMLGRDPDYPRALTIITGKGLHSSGGVSKLKPGLRTFLAGVERIQYLEEDDGFKIRFRD